MKRGRILTEAKSFYWAPKLNCSTISNEKHLRARSVQKSRFYFKQQHIHTTFSKYTYSKTKDCTSLASLLWFINCYNYICNQVELLHHSLPMSWMLLGFTGTIVQHTITASSSWKKPHNLSIHYYCNLEASATSLSILNREMLFKTSVANHELQGNTLHT